MVVDIFLATPNPEQGSLLYTFRYVSNGIVKWDRQRFPRDDRQWEIRRMPLFPEIAVVPHVGNKVVIIPPRWAAFSFNPNKYLDPAFGASVFQIDPVHNVLRLMRHNNPFKPTPLHGAA